MPKGHPCVPGCTCNKHNMHRERICGIYAVLNIETGETYIGSSVDIIRRIDAHINSIKTMKYGMKTILNAVEEYGIDAFTFLILEECKPEEQYQKETEWLQFWKPEYNGLFEASLYNRGIDRPFLIGNQYMKGKKESPENTMKKSERMKGNKFALGKNLGNQFARKYEVKV